MVCQRSYKRKPLGTQKKPETPSPMLTFRAEVSIIKHVDKTRGACVPG